MSLADISLLYHQGFRWDCYQSKVWEKEELVDSDFQNHSLHPPQHVQHPKVWIEKQAQKEQVLEIMPVGRFLGCGTDLELAMDIGVRLAVDISHVFIQHSQGVITEQTRTRLYNYDNISEIHVSHSDGRFDLHRSIGVDSYGVDWALERKVSETPIILECYIHRERAFLVGGITLNLRVI